MRWIYVLFLTVFLGGGSLAIDARDYKTAYDLLRNGLCALRITCLLPADMIYPADWQRDVQSRLERSREVLIIGDVQSFQPVIQYLDGWLRTTDPQRQQQRPQIFAVVPQEQVVWFRGWTENRELSSFVKVAASSNENEPLGVVGRTGLPLLILDNQVVYMPSWWQLDGPTLRQVLTWGRLLVDQIRNAQQRKQEVK
ncbi:hypothetical protein Mlute_00102 [Meiothermus luteus]|uniref:Uncharacterized protein n=1 Tax=Meiothermus luteus TaxID=2026184 RepID=A0A399F2F0_9DEIN|nr:hypothetical protein [Meiothermus luteus]RIH90180.1 hypothetical protein Mlute_00102 [Meiothermus luteus]